MGLPKNYGRANNPLGLGGRPRLSFVTAKKINVQVDLQTHNSLQEQAKRFQMPYNDVVRMLLKRKLGTPQATTITKKKALPAVQASAPCKRCKDPASKSEHTCAKYKQLLHADYAEPEESPFNDASEVRAKGAAELDKLVHAIKHL